MPVKTKEQLKKLTNPELIAYFDSITKKEFDTMFDGNSKSRYFIAKYGEGIAKAIKGTKLFFPAVIAMKINETQYGSKMPGGKTSNNFGGIKYNPSIHKNYVVADGYEYINGKKTRVSNMKWAKFDTAEEGFKGVVDVLMAKRYDKARTQKTAEEQIKEIVKAGYSTTPPAQYLKDCQQFINYVRKSLPSIGGLIE